jgi:transcription elongation factor Elf1
MSSSENSKQGMPCPNCQHPLPISIDMILKGQLHCVSCGLQLTVDAEKSSDSLDKLQALQQAQIELAQSGGSALPQGSVDIKIKGNN